MKQITNEIAFREYVAKALEQSQQYKITIIKKVNESDTVSSADKYCQGSQGKTKEILGYDERNGEIKSKTIFEYLDNDTTLIERVI